jgi:glycosyltransferase involved in cell wall biosynthesis
MIEFAHMNILFFSRLFYPHIGGVEKHVFEISRILIKKGHRVSVVTEGHAQSLKEYEVIKGIRVYRIPNLREGKNKKFEIWKWLWINKKLIKNADIIHCHDVFFWYLPFRFLFPFKKVCTTFHGYEGYPLKTSSILMHKISEKLSMGNICVGDFIKKWYGTRPTYTEYGGVGISNFQFPISNKIKKESAIFIGRFEEETGILTYVDSVEILKKKIPSFDFLAIGEGSLKTQINKKVKVLNPVNNVSEYLQSYNFAFVSGYLSILEAMAAKKLVFSVYNNPLKADYLKMAPFSKYIVIVNSSAELASKVQFYLNNPVEREKLANSAYKWVSKQTWNKIVNIFLKLWKL